MRHRRSRQRARYYKRKMRRLLRARRTSNTTRTFLKEIPTNDQVAFADYLEKDKNYDKGTVTGAGAALAVMQDGATIGADLFEGEISGYCDTQEIDTDIVNRIVNTFPSNVEQDTDDAQDSADGGSDTPKNKYSVNDNMKMAINSLLNPASGGTITDIDDILNENGALEEALAKTKAELTKALTKARSAPMVTKGKSTTSLGELTFEVVEKPAGDLFTFKGKKPKNFNLDIPTLVWKDAKGNEVEHPHVPERDDKYQFSQLNVLLFLTAVTRGMNSWLFGHTGTGKSTFVEQVANRIGWPVTRINLDSDMERADLVGQIGLREEKGVTVSKYEEGILPTAMQQPGFLLMDEIDAGRPDILFVVQRALENKGLLLTEDNGRVVEPHPLFRFTATANTRGSGDEYGMYAGTKTMNASMVDRFTAFLEFDYLDVKTEQTLLTEMNPALPDTIAEKMANFAKEIRSAFAKGEVYTTISPRGLGVLADSFVTFTGLGIKDNLALNMAMEMSTLNKVTADNKQKFIEIASRVFGFKVK